VIAAALILAAGRGERMGAPKALLRVDGVWLLEAHAQRLLEAGCARVLAAVPAGLQIDRLPSAVRVLGVATRSQSETLAAALKALAAETPLSDDERVLITPVDLRPPALATLAALIATDADAACPRHHGQHGHPLLVRAGLLAPYWRGETPALATLLHDRRCFVDVDDPVTVEDLDAPGDLPRV
jgi:CTP:molybdopterin cytidylyltransferase MocA